MKTTLKTFLMMAVVAFMALPIQAQNTESPEPVKETPKTTNSNALGTFVDKNNNGICDNFEARQTTQRGNNFVDKDGDGICDNSRDKGRKGTAKGKGNAGCRQGKGKGNAYGCGNGSGGAYRHRGNGNQTNTDNTK